MRKICRINRLKILLERLIKCSQDYFEHLVEFDYLIYSTKFKSNKCYTISAKEDNYLHLTGVLTQLSASEFFKRCKNGTLSCDDFELGSSSNKGSIRRKMSILENAIKVFTQENIIVEENFHKNNISCSFASTDGSCTLGFILAKNAKPRTLLKGNVIKEPIETDLLLKISKDGSYNILINLNNLSNDEIEFMLSTFY